MKEIKILSFSDEREIGNISIEKGSLIFKIKEKIMEEKIRKIADNPLIYLKDEEIPGGVKTVKAQAEPGTEEHLRVLLFELRKIGMDGRVIS